MNRRQAEEIARKHYPARSPVHGFGYTVEKGVLLETMTGTAFVLVTYGKKDLERLIGMCELALRTMPKQPKPKRKKRK
jgi:hypothetical protein